MYFNSTSETHQVSPHTKVVCFWALNSMLFIGLFVHLSGSQPGSDFAPIIWPQSCHPPTIKELSLQNINGICSDSLGYPNAVNHYNHFTLFLQSQVFWVPSTAPKVSHFFQQLHCMAVTSTHIQWIDSLSTEI